MLIQTIICPKCTHCFPINGGKRVKFHKRNIRKLRQTHLKKYFPYVNRKKRLNRKKWVDSLFHKLYLDIKSLNIE